MGARQSRANAEENNFPVYTAVIHKQPELRIDRYRANEVTATSLYPATLSDGLDSIHVVAKVTSISAMSPAALEKLRSCARIHRSLQDHCSILKIYGTKQTNTFFALLLEKAEGSLRDILQPDGPEMEALRVEFLASISPRKVVQDIFLGLAYIHSKTDEVEDKISHRDVKPENLLIVRSKRDGTFSIKFTDFDSAKQLMTTERVKITTKAFTEEYKDPNIDKRIKAGETVEVEDYLSADVWAAGLVAYEVLGDGTHLFLPVNEQSMLAMIHNGDHSNLDQIDMDELAKNLIYTLTQKRPEERITMKEAVLAPFFQDESHHIEALNQVIEALLQMNDSTSSMEIKEAFNKSFYMVYQRKWKELPFVLPEALKNSKYSNSMEGYYLCCQNLVVHVGQHKDAFVKKYGKELEPREVLREILKETHRAIIHLFWFAKRYLPELPFLRNFPIQCALAYEQLMEREKQKIEGGFDLLYASVSAEPKQGDVTQDREMIMENALDQLHTEIMQILNKSENDFEEFKDYMKKWSNNRKKLELKVENLVKLNASQAEIEYAKSQLVAFEKGFEKRMRLKLMLDYQEMMRNPQKYPQCKSSDEICTL